MNAVVLSASWLLAAWGVLAGLTAAVLTGRLRAGLSLGLDFLLGAGLLRLGLAQTWPAIATAASLVVIRKVVMLGLQPREEARSHAVGPTGFGSHRPG